MGLWARWFGTGKSDKLGPRGEKLAARYAKRDLKMRIVGRNVLCPGGELDIVALDGSDIVFIEVRTVTSEAYGSPEATVRRPRKQQALLRAARWYLQHRGLSGGTGRSATSSPSAKKRPADRPGLTPRFDIIAIIWPPTGQPQIRYQRNAFTLRRW